MLWGAMSTPLRPGPLALCVLTALLWLPLLLTPQHSSYDAGYWWTPPWAIEEALHPTGRFISFRQGIFDGNFLGAYWLALLVMPAASGYRALRGGGGVAMVAGAAFGTVWLVGYHVVVLIVAFPSWGVLVALAWFACTFVVGLVWFGRDRKAR